MGKFVEYGLESDDYGNKYTVVHVFGEDCKDAVKIMEEIKEIVRDAIPTASWRASWRNYIEFLVISSNEVKARIRGDFVEYFVERGYKV